MRQTKQEKLFLLFEYWAKAISEEIKPDEDGDIRSVSAVIASFTRLAYPSEIKVFLDWCKNNGYENIKIN